MARAKGKERRIEGASLGAVLGTLPCMGFLLAVSLLLTSVLHPDSFGDLVASAQVFWAEVWHGESHRATTLALDHLLSVLEDASAGQEAAMAACRAHVGLVADLDVIVDGVDFVERLRTTSDAAPSVQAVHHGDVESPGDLLEVFAVFFKEGAAAERTATDRGVFRELVRVAQGMDGARTALGGNGALVANRLAAEGCTVLLSAPIGERLQPMLHKRVTAVSPPADVSASDLHEDVHLILEYARGASWNGLVSPRANRFILTNDYANTALRVLDTFVDDFVTFGGNLVVVSGLQLLDGMRIDGRRAMFERMAAILDEVPRDVPIHFELASMADVEMYREIVDILLPHVDSLGSNEQELEALYHFLKSDTLDVVNPSMPEADTATRHVDGVLALLHERSVRTRALTRLHLHTLPFQLVAHAGDASRLWADARVSAVAASLRGTRHTCGGRESIRVRDVALAMPPEYHVERTDGGPRTIAFDPANASVCWRHNELRLCLAPVLTCRRPTQTVGGGDNISATGLAWDVRRPTEDDLPPEAPHGEDM